MQLTPEQERLGEELLANIQTLSSSIWRSNADGPSIDEWLRSFGADCDPNTYGRLHALYLLSRFIYFGDDEIRGLLRSLYRDFYRYPIIAAFRRAAANSRDEHLINAACALALKRTRFLGMGNPSESGTHLLYHYRQENMLSRDNFIGLHDAFDWAKAVPTLADPTVTRYIFIDDFCGSGQQATQYSQGPLARLRAAAARAGVTIAIDYHVLIARKQGLDLVKQHTQFDDVACVLELDESYRTFSPASRYFRDASSALVDKSFAEALATYYGAQLVPSNPLGFDDGQLMLGFIHNTPDNTLPIFWHPGKTGRPWHPVFRRYHKL